MTPVKESGTQGAWSVVALALPLPQREPVASLRATGEVYLNGTRVPQEATVYPGDVVRTGATGNAAAELPREGTILISPQTQVSFASPGQYFATLNRGAVSVHSLAGATNLQVKIRDFVVIPDPAAAETGAEIGLAQDGLARVKATVGSVGVVDLHGVQTVFIHAGEEVSISPTGSLSRVTPAPTAPAAPAAPSAPGPAVAAKSHKAWIALVVAGGGAGGVAAALASRGHAAALSPSAP